MSKYTNIHGKINLDDYQKVKDFTTGQTNQVGLKKKKGKAISLANYQKKIMINSKIIAKALLKQQDLNLINIEDAQKFLLI